MWSRVRFSPYISDYQGISDRLAMLSLQRNNNKIVFIQVYFPTTSYPDEDVEKLYDQIQKLIDNIPQRDFLFVMGDFNARVGGLHPTYPKCVGKYTIGSNSKRGEQLASFCSANNFYITNTFFPKRKLHTWNHPNSNSKGQIDFILSRNRFCQNVTNASVLSTPSISDHLFLCVIVEMDYIWRKPKPLVKKYNVLALKNIETCASFQLELSNRFLPLINAHPIEVDEFSEAINREIIETADKITPPVKSPTPQWMQPILEVLLIIRKMFGKSMVTLLLSTK